MEPGPNVPFTSGSKHPSCSDESSAQDQFPLLAEVNFAIPGQNSMLETNFSQKRKTIPKVVVVAMLDSVHVARWLSNMVSLNMEVTLFPSSPHRRIHPVISGLLRDHSKTFQLSRFWRLLSLPVWIADHLPGLSIRQWALKRQVFRTSPLFVHALESQSAGYLASSALPSNVMPLFLTLFGSDLFWFSRIPKHQKALNALLQRVSYLASECSRDLVIAQRLGFKGQYFKLGPVSGGLIIDDSVRLLAEVAPASRHVIAVKGYTNFVGRAQIALSALRGLRHRLGPFQIIVYSATYRARLEVFLMKRLLKMNVRAVPKRAMSHSETLALLARSSVLVAVSDSDGLPSSMCEAMAVGTFVIQSGTACCEELIEHQENGYILGENNRDAVTAALLFWLQNSAAVNNAARLNMTKMAEFLDPVRRREEAVNNYQSIIADLG